MSTRKIEIEVSDRIFEHGELTTQDCHGEIKIKAHINLVVIHEDVEAFHEELQELIKKYAI